MKLNSWIFYWEMKCIKTHSEDKTKDPYIFQLVSFSNLFSKSILSVPSGKFEKWSLRNVAYISVISYYCCQNIYVHTHGLQCHLNNDVVQTQRQDYKATYNCAWLPRFYYDWTLKIWVKCYFLDFLGRNWANVHNICQ